LVGAGVDLLQFRLAAAFSTTQTTVLAASGTGQAAKHRGSSYLPLRESASAALNSPSAYGGEGGFRALLNTSPRGGTMRAPPFLAVQGLPVGVAGGGRGGGYMAAILTVPEPTITQRGNSIAAKTPTLNHCEHEPSSQKAMTITCIFFTDRALLQAALAVPLFRQRPIGGFSLNSPSSFHIV